MIEKVGICFFNIDTPEEQKEFINMIGSYPEKVRFCLEIIKE